MLMALWRQATTTSSIMNPSKRMSPVFQWPSFIPSLPRHLISDLFIFALWSKVGKNTDKIAIQSFTVPRAREWAKWASERTSERSGGREQSEQSGASERVSGASDRANGRASGPVLTSRFLFVPDHSAIVKGTAQRFLSFPVIASWLLPELMKLEVTKPIPCFFSHPLPLPGNRNQFL